VSLERYWSRIRGGLLRRFRSLVFHGTLYDVQLSKTAIRRLITRGFSSNLTIIEVGAADGLDTAEFLKVFPEPDFRLIAIEPEPRNLARFRLLINDPRVLLIDGAISDRDGTAQLHVSNTEYSSSLKTPNLSALQQKWPTMEFGSSLEVSTRSLDSLTEQLHVSRVDFIWADVQGAEDLLLSGAFQTLLKTRYLYIEYSHSQESLYEGELSLRQLADRLGKDWNLLRDFGTDALFKNCKWNIIS
jgi:2-O-methyltransferase